jgi:two-component system, cell cycle sensor histidine kinase and response regulator CckA
MPTDADKPTVLVVDDDRQVRVFIRAVLLRQGYEVLEADDGVAAYELLQQLSGRVKLLVTDVQMPRMDGITLGQKVSADYPGLKVLYISGFVSDLRTNIPSDHFLPKPFALDVLVQRVRTLAA